MSCVNSPNPECLLDAMVQIRAKSARVQSLRFLSQDSTVKLPLLLNKLNK